MSLRGEATSRRTYRVDRRPTNEVPKFRGGTHWEEDGPGNRDFEIGDHDTNRKHLDDLTARLSSAVDDRLATLIAEVRSDQPAVEAALTTVRERAAAVLPSVLRSGGLKDLTEFGRAVHAEMDALLDSARRGVPVSGSQVRGGSGWVRRATTTRSSVSGRYVATKSSKKRGR